ncbi:glycosyltransferase family 39 protein [bacterium]|nr:glycosyltransferase family 39 protein [bacterium]
MSNLLKGFLARPDTDADSDSSSPISYQKYSFILLWGIPFLVVLATRLPYFGLVNLNSDEGLYTMVARAMEHGGVPYRDAWDHAAPGVFYLYRILFIIFGEWNIGIIRIAALLAHFATAMVVAMEMRRRYDNYIGALSGALVAVAVGGYMATDVVAALTETFLLPFLLAVALFIMRWAEGNRLNTILTGVCIAFAAWFKIHAVFISVILLAAGFYARKLNNTSERELSSAIKALLWSAAAYFLLVLPLFIAGGFGDYMRMYLGYNLFYFQAGGYDTVFLQGVWRTAWQWGLPQFMVVALGAGALTHLLHQNSSTFSRGLVLAAGLGGGLLLGVAGGRLFGHYFMPAAGFAGWLAGEGAAYLINRNKTLQREQWVPLAVAGGILLLAGIVHPIVRFHGGAYEGRARLAQSGMKIRPPFPQLIAAVQKVTEPEEKSWVWGFAPEIYVYAERDCASRFINANYLVGLVPWVNAAPDIDTSPMIIPESWNMLMSDLQKTPPALIIDAASAGYQFWGKYPISNYRQLYRYIEKHYADAGSYDEFKIYLRRDVARREGLLSKESEQQQLEELHQQELRDTQEE